MAKQNAAAAAVAKSQAKALAQGRIRLAGILSAAGSERLERLSRAHGGRVAAIEAALGVADSPASDDALIAVLTKRLRGRAR